MNSLRAMRRTNMHAYLHTDRDSLLYIDKCSYVNVLRADFDTK